MEYWLRMPIVKTLLLPPSLKCALGRWVKDVLKIRDWLPPKNYGDPTLSPRVPWEVVMFIPFAKRRFVCSASTSLAHMVVETIARGTWSPVATKIMNLWKKSQPSCLKFLEAKRGEGQQDIIRAEALMCDLLVVKTCNHHNPWIYWCF